MPEHLSRNRHSRMGKENIWAKIMAEVQQKHARAPDEEPSWQYGKVKYPGQGPFHFHVDTNECLYLETTYFGRSYDRKPSPLTLWQCLQR